MTVTKAIRIKLIRKVPDRPSKTTSIFLPQGKFPKKPVKRVRRSSTADCQPRQFQEKNMPVVEPSGRSINRCDTVGLASIPKGLKIKETALVSKGTTFRVKKVYKPVFSTILVKISLKVVNRGRLMRRKTNIIKRFLDTPLKPVKILCPNGDCAVVLFLSMPSIPSSPFNHGNPTNNCRQKYQQILRYYNICPVDISIVPCNRLAPMDKYAIRRLIV